MGAYREQLLRETYGNKAHSFMEPEGREPSGSLAVFKLKFTVSLFLFAGFVYLGMTGNSFCNVTAEQNCGSGNRGGSLRTAFRTWTLRTAGSMIR